MFKSVALAVSLVLALTSAPEQERRFRVGGLNPTLPELYGDSSRPELKRLLAGFRSAIPRPSRITGNRYNRASSEIWDQMHEILAGGVSPEAGLSRLDQALRRIGREGRW